MARQVLAQEDVGMVRYSMGRSKSWLRRLGLPRDARRPWDLQVAWMCTHAVVGTPQPIIAVRLSHRSDCRQARPC